MSRKKILKKDNIKDFTPLTVGDRINFIIANHNLSGSKFAKLLNISSGNLNGLINDDSKPSTALCCRILEIFRINLNWLLAGEGSPYINNDIKGELFFEDPVGSILTMTKQVLESETEYATSLTAFIQSSFKALELEKRTSTLEDTCQQLAKKVNALETANNKDPQ